MTTDGCCWCRCRWWWWWWWWWCCITLFSVFFLHHLCNEGRWNRNAFAVDVLHSGRLAKFKSWTNEARIDVDSLPLCVHSLPTNSFLVPMRASMNVHSTTCLSEVASQLNQPANHHCRLVANQKKKEEDEKKSECDLALTLSLSVAMKNGRKL